LLNDTSVELYGDAMLDLHRLRVFRTVVATGSVTGAATSLGYTSSAVSQQLSALQRETGLILLERRGRGIAPTAAGTVFAEQLNGVFERLAHVDGVVGDLRAGRTGTLTVSYFASAGTAWIPPVVAALVREFPDLRLDLRLVELAGEAAAEADLEIRVHGDQVASGADHREIELLREPYLVVLPAAHRFADHSAVPLAELRDELWVDNDFSRGVCRQVVLDACAAAGFAPAFRIETHDYPSAIAFVAEGVGITVLPRLGAAPLPAGVRAVPVVDPVPYRRVVLRTRDAVCGHPAVQRATALLRERAAGTAVAG
jgi:DNA-binding transcriptional LysR family regulator